ncbi:nicotinamide riboside transporter PnuC [Pedobacter nutrimenti]|uniref:nicotinamide riboside transporter PnuC n=1 Tax=Pedobacter nutrimenti TaxID=1241337 RepID=UPI00292D37E7|nr:nicotinamide riboside transporter PnuC [Pedobacter nutrimenti]
MLLLDIPFLQSLISQFQQTSLLEWVGTISGFICIYLAAKENIWNWPVSIISVLAYSIVFYESKLYGDTVLQFYFLSTAFYGWYYWLKKKTAKEKPVTSIGGKQWLYIIGGVLVLTVLLGLFLSKYTDTDVPYIDGFCTAMSFVAQLLMTRKILQNWLLWIVVDICYVPLYIHKHLSLTAILYFVLIILAIIGYLDWRKTYREQIN